MKKITNAQAAALAILGKTKPSDSGYRLMKYCAQVQVDEGVLLLNMVTKELLLLTKAEYADLTNLDYLKEHWFVVPETLNEKESVDTLKWVLQNTSKKSNAITFYTILTTTDCNARCFYCFEKGCSRVPMSEETAHKTAKYIGQHCCGKPVTLSWFGGEPLYNLPIIDLICEDLRRDGIEYKSEMISNGYLFDEDTVKKAVESWNLKMVQITLDGTENVYNKSKAYIYREGSPYQVVLQNIGRLLDAKINVKIRLNLDLYNAENLLTLVDELADRFGGKPGLCVYGHHLYDINQPSKEIHSDEQWALRYEAMHRLEDRIEEKKLAPKRGIKSKIKITYCGADSDNSVMILPTGDIGRCRDRIDAEYVGHIDREGFNRELTASWKERMPELPECADCVYYPECIRLKKCITNSECFRYFREEKLRLIRKSMESEYQSWRTRAASEKRKDSV